MSISSTKTLKTERAGSLYHQRSNDLKNDDYNNNNNNNNNNVGVDAASLCILEGAVAGKCFP